MYGSQARLLKFVAGGDLAPEAELQATERRRDMEEAHCSAMGEIERGLEKIEEE